MALLLARALSPGVDSLAVPPSPNGRSVEAISDVFRLLHGPGNPSRGRFLEDMAMSLDVFVSLRGTNSEENNFEQE